MTTQTEQTEFFPRTTLELLEELAEVHRADQDKAMKALDALSDDEKIARAYEKAEERLAKARHLVAAIDQAAERERKRLTTTAYPPGVSQVATDIVNSGALDTEDLQVTASVSPTVDSITGEVAPANPPRLPVNACVVIALYPGSGEPHVTKIGDRTRYGELVADYFTAAGLNGKHNAKDWTVVAEDELTTTGGARKLRDIITGADYGKRLLVVAADQGSVTGVKDGAS